MNWILIAITAHFLFALVFIIDKVILSKTVLRPIVYAFYTGIFQILVLVLAPFGFSVLPINQILIALLAGALFTLAVLFLYRSIDSGEVSRITPVIGGSIPVFTLILSYWFLSERLTNYQLIAFLFLVSGAVIMLLPQRGAKSFKGSWVSGLLIAGLSAFLFAGSFVLTKYIFTVQPFINGLIWTRFGGFLMAGLFLVSVRNRHLIFSKTEDVKSRTVGLFISDKVLSALAFVLLNYAIFLGSVSLVNALQGIQYAFLLLLGLVFLKERFSQKIIFQKVIAIIFITLGLVILTV